MLHYKQFQSDKALYCNREIARFIPAWFFVLGKDILRPFFHLRCRLKVEIPCAYRADEYEEL